MTFECDEKPHWGLSASLEADGQRTISMRVRESAEGGRTGGRGRCGMCRHWPCRYRIEDRARGRRKEGGRQTYWARASFCVLGMSPRVIASAACMMRSRSATASSSYSESGSTFQIPAMSGVTVRYLRRLRGDESEHQMLIPWEVSEWLKASCVIGSVF